MKRTYFVLAVIGTILPNIFVVKETIESGNFMLYADPLATMHGMFANNICSAFALDLLFVVILFLWWSFQESKKLQIKKWWVFCIYTFALGIAGGLPLFLWYREDFLNK